MTHADTVNKMSKSSPEIIMGTSALGVPIMLTAVRCTLLYIIVPFVLPIIGGSGTFSPIVNITAGLGGITVIIFNLTRLWHTSWRNRYIVVSLFVVPLILLSLYFDYIAYLNA